VTPHVAQVIIKHLQQLEAAGMPTTDVEFAREFLTDAGSAEKDEAELLLDIGAAWNLVRDVAKRKGAKL
jgi:hypothetical protein